MKSRINIEQLRTALAANGWRLRKYCQNSPVAISESEVKAQLAETAEGMALLDELRRSRPKRGASGSHVAPKLVVRGWEPELLARVREAGGSDVGAWVREACRQRLSEKK